MEMSAAHSSPPRGTSAQFLVRFVRPFWDLFNSIKLGIFLIVLIFLYGALGSAVPLLRQFFELTEFQYFNHWIFSALILLFCINLIVATVRRIRFNWINAGVLTVHAGLLLLCGSSVWYFGSKVEGDVLIAPPTISIMSRDRFQTDPSTAQIGQPLVAAKGRDWEQNIPMLGGKHRVEVVDVKHLGLRTADEVTLQVTAPGAEPATAVLRHDTSEEQFARYGPVGPKLMARLNPAAPVDVFYDNTTPSLTLIVGATENDRREIPLPELPFYKERFIALHEGKDTSEPPLLDLNGQVVPSKRITPIPLVEKWRMPVPVLRKEDALARDLGYTVEIDAYLPYAQPQNRAVEGGATFSPLVSLLVGHDSHQHEAYLFAAIPSESLFEAENGARVEFNWLGDRTELDAAWTRPVAGKHYLEVEIKDKGIKKAFDVTEGQKIAIEGTDYTLTIEQLRASWPLMSQGFQGARTSIALVWIETPAQSFQRSVLDRFTELNQDRDRAGQKIRDDGGLVDPNIEIRYTDAATPHTRIVAGNNFAPTIIHTAVGGARDVRKLPAKQPVKLDDAFALTLRDLILRPRGEPHPVIIPEKNRRSLMDVGRQQSLIRVHLTALDGSWSRRAWVPFNQYNLDHADMFGGEPTTVTDLPSGRNIAFIYGRSTSKLPAALMLEQLITRYYPGGQQAKEWTSVFRYEDPHTRDVKVGRAYLNNTYTIDEWTFFQSAAATDGASWTVLGVGNRNGVMLQLLACTLISLGMTYAFAVKPILVRRRKERLMANSGRAAGNGENGEPKRARAFRETGSVALKLMPLILLFGAAGCKNETLVSGKALDEILAIEKDIDIEKLGAIAMLDDSAWRYTTVESWARKTMQTMHGRMSLEGLDPVVSAMEIMFNGDAYADQPVVYVKDRGVLKDLTKHPIVITDKDAEKMFKSKHVSASFLARPDVDKRVRELAGETFKNKAMGRMRNAQAHFERIGELFTVVPVPNGNDETPWLPPIALLNTPMRENAGITPEQAASVLEPFKNLAQAWRQRDAAQINKAVAQLDTVLPHLSPKGLYPTLEMRHGEQNYRRLGLLRYSWGTYIVAFFFSIFAVATRYRWIRFVGLVLLVAALGIHGYDIALRWGVLGRIPAANMFEAVTFSAWCGSAFGLLLEIFLRKRVFMLASAAVGFFALALPEVVPDTLNNNLSTMMPILDDAMLRIHTVLIIASYMVIALAYVIANCYLVVSATRQNSALARATIGAQLGAFVCITLAYRDVFAYFNNYGIIGVVALVVGAGAMIGIGGFSFISGAARPVGGAFDPSAFPVAETRSILDEFDLCHRVVLYTATVSLFVGIVLGAVWADYSWGRPWGWDPKEVFALNTWLIYAILIHARYVTKHRGLWTSVLSVIGFAVMVFNWVVVNFYIVGLHSYA